MGSGPLCLVPQASAGVVETVYRTQLVKTLGSVTVYECNFISLSVKTVLPKCLCKAVFQYTE